jgi:hypothetical protein
MSCSIDDIFTIINYFWGFTFGNVQVGQFLEFVESTGAMLTSFSQAALPAREYQ